MNNTSKVHNISEKILNSTIKIALAIEEQNKLKAIKHSNNQEKKCFIRNEIVLSPIDQISK